MIVVLAICAFWLITDLCLVVYSGCRCSWLITSLLGLMVVSMFLGLDFGDLVRVGFGFMMWFVSDLVVLGLLIWVCWF